MTALIAVAACFTAATERDTAYHSADDPYVAAIARMAGAIPLIVPALGDALDIDGLLQRVDGLLLTGSPSNLHPRHYGRADEAPCPPLDGRRDATTLPLIRRALDRDLPLLGICRGLQELNVALGGSLLAKIHEVPGRLDHRADVKQALERQFAPAHPVTLRPDGRLRAFATTERLMVNSLHGQGIDQLAESLQVEATAPDGQVEAVSMVGRRFVIGVQWHPEWGAESDPFSQRLFAALGEAAAGRRPWPCSPV